MILSVNDSVISLFSSSTSLRVHFDRPETESKEAPLSRGSEAAIIFKTTKPVEQALAGFSKHAACQ
jgi:hypothetical protein